MVKFLVLWIVFTVYVVTGNLYHEGSKIVLVPDKNAEYFGYSVLLRNTLPVQVAVGAPKASNGALDTGAVYTCNLAELKSANGSNTVICTQSQYLNERYKTREKDHYVKKGMFFGSVIVETKNSTLFVSAPRWYAPYKDSHYLLNGAYFSKTDFPRRTGDQFQAYIYLSNLSRQAYVIDGKRKEYGEYGLHLNYYAYAQTGFSMAVAPDKNVLVVGAPGLLQWSGGITILDTSDNNKAATPNPYDLNNIGPDEYFGYSVETGVFNVDGRTLFVGSAPRSKSGLGQVLIFDVIRSQYNTPVIVHGVLIGSQLGAYFGASLCVVDINNDGISDLLVGAPTFVKKSEELPFDQGAVFVYMTHNKNFNILLTLQGYIQGSNRNGARFGTSISSLGDVDGDGYSDVAIGAPFEDNGVGAVYIYRGTANGLRDKYSQRIVAEAAKGFGFAISKSLDIDRNGCNDLAIGAYDSQKTFIYKCVPTIKLETSIKVPDAMDLPQNSTNFKAIFCVKVENRIWPHIKLDLEATVTVDREAARARISDDPQYKISATPGQVLCEEKVVNVSPQADLSKPISILFHIERVQIIDEDLLTELPPNLSKLSEDSILHSSFDIQLTRDCGEDLICHPQIEMTITALSSPYIPGLSEKFGVKVTIMNVAEPAYGFKVNLILPVIPIRTPSLCTLDNLNMTCSIPSPLYRNEEVSWDIELEYNNLHFIDKESYDMPFVATLVEPFEFKKRNSSTIEELILKVSRRSNITMTGKTLTNNTVIISRKTYNEDKYVNFVHFFEITNYGPSSYPFLVTKFQFPDVSISQYHNNDCVRSKSNLVCEWTLPANVSIPIVLQLRLNTSSQGELSETGLLNVTTTAIAFVLHQNITADVTTTFVLEPTPPIWPIIVGIICGFILLSAITYLLFKRGFFSRQRREDLKRLKESTQEASSSQTVDLKYETIGNNDDSSEELLDDLESD